MKRFGKFGMAEKKRLPTHQRELLDLKTGDRFSADRGDYFTRKDSQRILGDIALVDVRPATGKNVVGGFKLVVIKRNPTYGDLK
jgi:hypothetical protein